MLPLLTTIVRMPKPKMNGERGEISPKGQNEPLLPIHNLEGYSEEELKEYRQVFNIFDTDGSGAIGEEELEAAMHNLGLETTKEELDKIIDEVDKRGNHEIDFDEFCEVMRRLNAKKSSWKEVIQQCFIVFDRTEAGIISKRDFQYVLREIGEIRDNAIIDEIWSLVDVDGNGIIDMDEFADMVRDYMKDEDIESHPPTRTVNLINDNSLYSHSLQFNMH
ncbi:hypothetical protein PMAYCL1PPCAC_29189 [Pristionchus mayeri]|uniref:EF-hand domain-containing protein n=1 Tax=Pristionchus mayeri TaxID=1317129 RepID=A0AAN5IBX1_9BILA|nr:hypothetical protein PMAYCL1PPCAC_29189 [Pristionchus mayeri]